MEPLSATKDVMTLEEVAGYLQVSEKSILRMAQTGRIPTAKVANHWRFTRSVIDDWLMALVEIPTLRSALPKKEPPKLPSLSNLMPAALYNVDIIPDTKERVLRQLIQPLRKTGVLRRLNPFLDSILGREALVSTAIGHGIAIPHARRPMLGMFKEPLVGLGVCREGAEFDALDHQRTYVFFLLCSPNEDIQLRLLARVIELGHQGAVVEGIKKVRTIEEATRILQAANRYFEGRAACKTPRKEAPQVILQAIIQPRHRPLWGFASGSVVRNTLRS